MRPLKFHIQDFKSIRDSGICELSGDGITVLAGQNECGKTAILSALRDFDLDQGEVPDTEEYEPDNRLDAVPSVSVQFEINADQIRSWLAIEESAIPDPVLQKLSRQKLIWIKRDLKSGEFNLEPEISGLWNAESAEQGALSEHDFLDMLRNRWPLFLYFDSFNDILPRSVEFELLKEPKPSPAPPTTATLPAQSSAPGGLAAAARTAVTIPDATQPAAKKKKAPQAVRDFIALADIDLDKVLHFSQENKLLNNYLGSREAKITKEFLGFWKQRVNQNASISLKVKHVRNQAGTLCLEFYVHDQSDQYPDQRSKGFLWFLSFYLRLAAPHSRMTNDSIGRVLLIDEPGTYLHARAQKDVLDLFEMKLAKKDWIIYSTHSPYLLPADRLHRLRVVLKTAEEGTLVLDRLTHPLLRKGEFSDTMSPILAAIGLDIREALTLVHNKNAILEGISDHYYVTAWDNQFGTAICNECNLFPATGATSTVTLASLFVGWGLDFVIVLDRDKAGEAAKEKLVQKLGIDLAVIVQPNQAKNIEDLFSFEDFKSLLKSQDDDLTMEQGETPTKAIERQNIDKVVLARKYAELASAGKITLTQKSTDNIRRFLETIKDKLHAQAQKN